MRRRVGRGSKLVIVRELDNQSVYERVINQKKVIIRRCVCLVDGRCICMCPSPSPRGDALTLLWLYSLSLTTEANGNGH